MKRLVKAMLAAIFALVSRRKFATWHLGKGSMVASWRLHPRRANDLVIGDESIVETKVIFERENAAVQIGNRTFVGQGSISVASKVVIGDDVLVAWGTPIADHASRSLRYSERASDVTQWQIGRKDWSNVPISEVSIGNKAWIGFNSIILKGISIGVGAVVGAGSVVTKNVPPWTIVTGNPARIIREISQDER